MAKLIWLHMELSRRGANKVDDASVTPDLRQSALALNCQSRADVVNRLSEILDELKVRGTSVGVPDFDDF